MTSSSGHPQSAAQEMLAWVQERRSAHQASSIALCSHRALDLDNLGAQLANYLNEFDPDGMGSWRNFDFEAIRHAAGDPDLRQAIHDASFPLVSADPEATDFDQAIAGLGVLGHAILEGEACLSATRHTESVFKVCLDFQPTGPNQELCCDLWLNAPRFNPKSYISSIGDSFLEWLSHR